jgi:hypothetical protein
MDDPSIRGMARAATERSRREQGLPAHITDPAVLDQVAALVTPDQAPTLVGRGTAVAMTEQEHAALAAATEVAIAAPLRPSPNTHAALIPWSKVLDLRSALSAAGIDWRDAQVRANR